MLAWVSGCTKSSTVGDLKRYAALMTSLTCILYWCLSSWCMSLCSDSRVPCRQNGMTTSSNGNNFRVTGPLCGEFTGHRWIPLTKGSEAELWCFLDLRLNKRLSKQLRRWWFDTTLRSLWRHHNDLSKIIRWPDALDGRSATVYRSMMPSINLDYWIYYSWLQGDVEVIQNVIYIFV